MLKEVSELKKLTDETKAIDKKRYDEVSEKANSLRVKLAQEREFYAEAVENLDVDKVKELGPSVKAMEEVLSVYDREISRIESSLAISETEYKEKIEKALESMSKYNKEKATEVLALVEKIAEICTDVKDELEATNSALYDFQAYIGKGSTSFKCEEYTLPNLKRWLVGGGTGRENVKSLRYEALKRLVGGDI